MKNKNIVLKNRFAEHATKIWIKAFITSSLLGDVNLVSNFVYNKVVNMAQTAL